MIERSRVRLPTGAPSGNNSGQSYQYPRASVTKQYNLVPAKGRWCSAAGKVTVGLASHWPCVTDFSGLSTYGLNGHGKGDEHPPMLHTGAWSTLPNYLTYALNKRHRPLVSIQLCLVLPPPSSPSCTWVLLSTFLSPDLFSKYSLVALFLCGLVVSTVWWRCHHFLWYALPRQLNTLNFCTNPSFLSR